MYQEKCQWVKERDCGFFTKGQSVITNARCLTEVDIPEVDAVLFADQKK